jgi:hypothetical protein
MAHAWHHNCSDQRNPASRTRVSGPMLMYLCPFVDLAGLHPAAASKQQALPTIYWHRHHSWSTLIRS